MNVKKTNNHNVIVKCINKQNSEVISSLLQNDKLAISPIDRKNPQIKIIDVNTEMDIEQLKNNNKLTEDILVRNEPEADDFKIVHIFKQRNNKKSLIAEVSTTAYI